MATAHIKIERAFYLMGKPTKVGEVIEVGAAFAKELVTAHKASFADAPVRPDREQPTEVKPDPKAKPVATNEPKAAVPQKGEK